MEKICIREVSNCMNQVNSTYDKEQFAKQQRELADSLIKNIQDHMLQVPNYSKTLVSMMDLVEDTIRVCRGENIADFREVSRDTIKVYTRVSVHAPLIPQNGTGKTSTKRISRQVIELLLRHPMVRGVRWIPDEEGRGSYVILSLERDEKHE